jgi:hypothetical protein
MTNPDPITTEALPTPMKSYAGRSALELVFTSPDEETQRSLVAVAMVIVKGAQIFRSTDAPWQVRVRRGELDDAAWRKRVKNLIEAY